MRREGIGSAFDEIDDGTAKWIPWEQAREMILRDE
jgi:hypothetical protein